jgi:beta-galactosidase GanA
MRSSPWSRRLLLRPSLHKMITRCVTWETATALLHACMRTLCHKLHTMKSQQNTQQVAWHPYGMLKPNTMPFPEHQWPSPSQVAVSKDVVADTPENDKGTLVNDELEVPIVRDVTYWELAKEFSILGFIGFGGPAAHVGLFKRVRCGSHHRAVL